MFKAILAAIAVLVAAAPAPRFAVPTYTIVTANEKGASISIITSDRHVRTLRLPIDPHNVQSSQDGRLLFVVGSVPTAHEAGSHMMMSMEGTRPGDLILLDTAPFRPIARIGVGMEPAHVIADTLNRFAYVTVSGENAVKVVDLRKETVAAKIPTGKFPHGLRMSSDGRSIFIADMQGGSVSQVDLARRTEVARIAVGKRPVQVAIAAGAKRVYVSLAGENAVAVIDVPHKHVIAKIKVGRDPAQVFLSPDGARLYVANQGTADAPDHTVSVISTRSLRVIKAVAVGRGAHGVVVTPDGSRIYVTDAFANNVTEISAQRLP